MIRKHIETLNTLLVVIMTKWLGNFAAAFNVLVFTRGKANTTNLRYQHKGEKVTSVGACLIKFDAERKICGKWINLALSVFIALFIEPKPPIILPAYLKKCRGFYQDRVLWNFYWRKPYWPSWDFIVTSVWIFISSK